MGHSAVGVAPLERFQTSQITVGLTAVQLDATPLERRTSVSVKAHPDNTAVIYIGNSSAVTTSTGWPLDATESVEIDLSNSEDIWAISGSAGQIACLFEASEAR